METNNRNQVIHYVIIGGQFLFLSIGSFLVYTKDYGVAASVLLLTSGIPFVQFKGNRLISFLSWFSIGIAAIALGALFFDK